MVKVVAEYKGNKRTVIAKPFWSLGAAQIFIAQADPAGRRVLVVEDEED